VQVVVITFCSLAFAKVYTAKFPVTACDLLYNRVHLAHALECSQNVSWLSSSPGRELST